MTIAAHKFCRVGVDLVTEWQRLFGTGSVQ
jgi:hypothetical protein